MSRMLLASTRQRSKLSWTNMTFERNTLLLYGPYPFLFLSQRTYGYTLLHYSKFFVQTVWLYVTIEKERKNEDWYQNICTTLKWNLIRWIITQEKKIDERENEKIRKKPKRLRHNENCDCSNTKHVHSEFIHVENKGCQMKGKRNHSKMTVNENEAKETEKERTKNGLDGKRIPFRFDFKNVHSTTSRIQFGRNVGATTVIECHPSVIFLPFQLCGCKIRRYVPHSAYVFHRPTWIFIFMHSNFLDFTVNVLLTCEHVQ